MRRSGSTCASGRSSEDLTPEEPEEPAGGAALEGGDMALVVDATPATAARVSCVKMITRSVRGMKGSPRVTNEKEAFVCARTFLYDAFFRSSLE